MSSNESVYAFIDSQNLNLGVRSQGWQLDFGKFRLFLKNKYGVKKALLFIGYIEGNTKLYDNLSRLGFVLIFKNVLPVRKGKNTVYKGNVDAELVMHTMLNIEKFDSAVIVSGDGDFFCLIEHLENIGKLKKILTPNDKYSTLLKRYSPLIHSLSVQKGKLQKKRRHSRGK